MPDAAVLLELADQRLAPVRTAVGWEPPGDEVLDVAHASQVATITVVRAGAGGTTGSITSSDAIEGRP